MNSLLVFTPQLLLPPLDIFGSFCDPSSRQKNERQREGLFKAQAPLPRLITVTCSAQAQLHDFTVATLIHNKMLVFLHYTFPLCSDGDDALFLPGVGRLSHALRDGCDVYCLP